MKTKILLIAILIGFVSVANAIACTYTQPIEPGTIWEPTDSGQIDINYIGFDLYHKIAIFDDQSSLKDSDAHFILKSNPGLGFVWDSIELIAIGDDFGIRHKGMPNTPSVILKDSNRFQVAMKVNDTWLPGIDTIIPGIEPAYGQHIITWEGVDGMLTQIDAKPVPVPAAVYLLGVGLLGVAAFKKRI